MVWVPVLTSVIFSTGAYFSVDSKFQHRRLLGSRSTGVCSVTRGAPLSLGRTRNRPGPTADSPPPPPWAFWKTKNGKSDGEPGAQTRKSDGEPGAQRRRGKSDGFPRYPDSVSPRRNIPSSLAWWGEGKGSSLWTTATSSSWCLRQLKQRLEQWITPQQHQPEEQMHSNAS